MKEFYHLFRDSSLEKQLVWKQYPILVRDSKGLKESVEEPKGR